MQPPQSVEEIKAGLETTEKGGVRQSIRNCLTVFQRDPLLSGANVYDAKYVKWSIADLPILPQKWQYLVSASTKKQFGILKDLMNRPDVDSVICATDAG